MSIIVQDRNGGGTLPLIGLEEEGWETLETFAQLELGLTAYQSWMDFSNFEAQLKAQLYCRVPPDKLEPLTNLVMRAAIHRLTLLDCWPESILNWIIAKQRIDQLKEFVATQPIAWRVSINASGCLIGVFGPHYVGHVEESPYGPLNRGSSTDIMAY